MNPELFTIPGTETPISAYGFMIGLALVLAVRVGGLHGVGLVAEAVEVGIGGADG